MSNKLMKRLASLSMAAAMGSQALAVEWHPSRTQSEVGVVSTVATTAGGATVAVTSTPARNPANGSVLQVQNSQDVFIQVTTLSETEAVNDAINAANPGLSAGQMANNPTASGLSYAANGQLNNLYDQLNQASSVGILLVTTAPAAAASFTSVAGAPANAYTPIAVYDIAVSAGAARVIANSGSVTIALSVPGVADGVQLVAVCWDRAGNSRTVPVLVSGGVVYLAVTTSGPVMLLARTLG